MRVVIKKGANNLAEIVQQKGYYSFGMEISQFSAGTGTSKNWYNGKEIQDDFGLYWYDYGARFYDPQLGRWHVIDNKAEKYSGTSPYTYVLNNPIVFIDPDGNEVDVSYLAKNHQGSLQKMLSTKAGRTFVGRYMKAGDKLVVGGNSYSWDKSGDRSKDILQIATTNDLGAKGLNRTFKKGTYKETNTLIKSEMHEAIGEGVRQVIQLNSDLGGKEATVVLGHESFVHADKDADRLTELDNKISSGQASEKDLINTMIGVSSSASGDHKELGKGNVKKFGSMTNELRVC